MNQCKIRTERARHPDGVEDAGTLTGLCVEFHGGSGMIPQESEGSDESDFGETTMRYPAGLREDLCCLSALLHA